MPTLIHIRRADGRFHARLPDPRLAHAFVAGGGVRMGDDALGGGEAVRPTEAGALRLAADGGGPGGAEILAWEMGGTG